MSSPLEFITDAVNDLTEPTCAEQGCDGVAHTRRLCRPHYRAWYKLHAPRCSVAGCERPLSAHGLCQSHYLRRQPTPESLAQSAERFWSRVVWTQADCWEWTGQRVPTGYGRFNPVAAQSQRSHRWAWEYLVGPIPEGLTLDHLCRNRACVNPAHLEPVTQGENTQRGAVSRWEERGRRCINGHPTPRPTYDVSRHERRCHRCHLEATWRRRGKIA